MRQGVGNIVTGGVAPNVPTDSNVEMNIPSPSRNVQDGVFLDIVSGEIVWPARTSPPPGTRGRRRQATIEAVSTCTFACDRLAFTAPTSPGGGFFDRKETKGQPATATPGFPKSLDWDLNAANGTCGKGCSGTVCQRIVRPLPVVSDDDKSQENTAALRAGVFALYLGRETVENREGAAGVALSSSSSNNENHAVGSATGQHSDETIARVSAMELSMLRHEEKALARLHDGGKTHATANDDMGGIDHVVKRSGESDSFFVKRTISVVNQTVRVDVSGETRASKCVERSWLYRRPRLPRRRHAIASSPSSLTLLLHVGLRGLSASTRQLAHSTVTSTVTTFLMKLFIYLFIYIRQTLEKEDATLTRQLLIGKLPANYMEGGWCTRESYQMVKCCTGPRATSYEMSSRRADTTDSKRLPSE